MCQKVNESDKATKIVIFIKKIFAALYLADLATILRSSPKANLFRPVENNSSE